MKHLGLRKYPQPQVKRTNFSFLNSSPSSHAILRSLFIPCTWRYRDCIFAEVMFLPTRRQKTLTESNVRPRPAGGGHSVPQGAMEKLKGAETDGVDDRQLFVRAAAKERWAAGLDDPPLSSGRRLYAESAELSSQIAMQGVPKVPTRFGIGMSHTIYKVMQKCSGLVQ